GACARWQKKRRRISVAPALRDFTILLDELPLLVVAAIGRPLVHLRAGQGAIAVLQRLPLVVAGGAKRPLDDAGAVGGGSALNDGIEAALDAIDLVITVAGGDELPL